MEFLYLGYISYNGFVNWAFIISLISLFYIFVFEFEVGTPTILLLVEKVNMWTCFYRYVKLLAAAVDLRGNIAERVVFYCAEIQIYLLTDTSSRILYEWSYLALRAMLTQFYTRWAILLFPV